MGRAWVVAIVAGVVLGGAGGVGAQGAIWIHTTVDTRSAPGEQVSTFRAFTTSDQAGTTRVPITKICVKGIGHQVQEKCEDNAAFVEVVESATGLSGIGSLCVEAVASGDSRVGVLATTARACP